MQTIPRTESNLRHDVQSTRLLSSRSRDIVSRAGQRAKPKELQPRQWWRTERWKKCECVAIRQWISSAGSKKAGDGPKGIVKAKRTDIGIKNGVLDGYRGKILLTVRIN